MGVRNLLLLLGGVFLVAAFHITDGYFPWLSFYREFFAFVALLFFAQAVVCYRGRVGWSYVVIFCLFVALIPLVQAIFGVVFFWGDGVITSAYIFLFSLSIFVGGSLYKYLDSEFIVFLARCLVLAATVSSIMAIYQWFGLNNWGIWVFVKVPGGASVANLAQPNNLATLICLGLVSLLYLWAKRSVSALLSVTLSFLLLIGVVLAHSRTPWLMAGVFLIWFIWKKPVVNLRLAFSFVVFFIALYICFSGLVQLLNPEQGKVFAKNVAQLDIARKIIWGDLWYAVINGPWWGYGWNQVGLAHAMTVVETQTGFPLNRFTANSHNFFLDLLIWNGPVIGVVLIAGILFWGIKNALICRSLEAWYGLTFIGLLLTHGMLEYPLEYIYFLVPLGLFVGVVSVVNRSDRVVCQMPAWGLQVIVLSLIGAGGVLFYEYTTIEKDSRMMRFETTKIGVVRAEEKAPDVLFLTQLREYNRYARTTVQPGMNRYELEWMRMVAHRYAFQPALFRYALALGLNNRFQEARNELLRIKAIYGQQVYESSVENIDAQIEKHTGLRNALRLGNGV